MESEQLEAEENDITVSISVEGKTTEGVMEVFNELEAKAREVL
jgi:hypothetical protein